MFAVFGHLIDIACSSTGITTVARSRTSPSWSSSRQRVTCPREHVWISLAQRLYKTLLFSAPLNCNILVVEWTGPYVGDGRTLWSSARQSGHAPLEYTLVVCSLLCEEDGFPCCGIFLLRWRLLLYLVLVWTTISHIVCMVFRREIMLHLDVDFCVFFDEDYALFTMVWMPPRAS